MGWAPSGAVVEKGEALSGLRCTRRAAPRAAIDLVRRARCGAALCPAWQCGTCGSADELRRAPAAVAALVAGELPVERLPVDAQHARRPRAVVPDGVEHAE